MPTININDNNSRPLSQASAATIVTHSFILLLLLPEGRAGDT